jgi:hypothetical protein
MDGVYPRDYKIVTDPPPPGFKYAAQYTVGPDSTNGSAGQRALDGNWPAKKPGTTGKTLAYQGADTWYRDMLYLPSDFTPYPNQDWNFVYELHHYPDDYGDANVACATMTTKGSAGPWSDGGTSPERLSCRVIGGGSPAHPITGYSSATWPQNPDTRYKWFIGLDPLPRGRWIDLVFHVKWSYSGDGLFEWWVDGKKVAAYSGPNLYYYSDNGTGSAGPGQAYLQHGYYRPGDGTSTVRVLHAGTMVGKSAAALGEALP